MSLVVAVFYFPPFISSPPTVYIVNMHCGGVSSSFSGVAVLPSSDSCMLTMHASCLKNQLLSHQQKQPLVRASPARCSRAIVILGAAALVEHLNPSFCGLGLVCTRRELCLLRARESQKLVVAGQSLVSSTKTAPCTRLPCTLLARHCHLG